VIWLRCWRIAGSRSTTPRCIAESRSPGLCGDTGAAVRRYLRPCTGSWRVDETYIKVRGVWTYLYRAVDSLGQTIGFLPPARRDAAATKRFFRKALAQPHTVNPRTITVDKNPAYPLAATEMKQAGELWRFSRLRQCKCLKNTDGSSGWCGRASASATYELPSGH
jgi:transposase-like protein